MALNTTQEINSESSQYWRGVVFEQKFLDSIDKLAQRRFGSGALAEEAAAYTIDYLSEDNWRRCQQFQSLSSVSTFLYTLSGNALEEFSRKRFGRPRPPTWLKTLGELWVKIWRAICLERQLDQSVIDRYGYDSFRDYADVRDAIRLIKLKIPDCGLSIYEAEAVDDIGAVVDEDHAKRSFENGSAEERNLYEALTALIASLLDVESEHQNEYDQCYSHADSLISELKSQRESVCSSLALTDEERVMLRMVYVEGMSKSKCSLALGMPAHQAGRDLNALIERIRTVFSKTGIEMPAL